MRLLESSWHPCLARGFLCELVWVLRGWELFLSFHGRRGRLWGGELQAKLELQSACGTPARKGSAALEWLGKLRAQSLLGKNRALPSEEAAVGLAVHICGVEA